VSAILVHDAPAKKSVREGSLRPTSTPYDEPLTPDLSNYAGPSRLSQAAAVDTFQLGWYTFDTNGQPDTQGWVSVDLTAQIDEFFHVAGPSELDGGESGRLMPLQGLQSMWCGVAPSSDVPFCGYVTLPGYGNNWDQVFVSKTFYCDSIRFSYRVSWDSEPGYDKTEVQYFDEVGYWNWQALPVDSDRYLYDGTGTLDESFAVGLSGDSTTLRFRFTSDVVWSDEDGLYPSDGAVIIDSITIECFNNGLLTETYFEDFEDEVPGSNATDDGCWTTVRPPAYGDFSALYPGVTVVQEDPCVTNLTNLWGWFDDLTTYWCAWPIPYPSQGAMRYTAFNEFTEDYYSLNNEIWSPRIPFVGEGSEVRLSFLVYRDMPLENTQFYLWSVRSWIDGCPGPWKSAGFPYYGSQKDWLRTDFSIGEYIDPLADEIQIAVGAWDGCIVFCFSGPGFGCECCHSHAPLVDEIRVTRVNVTGPQSTVRHLDLFQDTFAEDGTLTGYARADAADDVGPYLTIRPGDSITLTVSDPQTGLATDPTTGVGPAVYAYIALWPMNQPGKTAPDLEAPETGAIGTRYPFVGNLTQDGVTWHCFRMDSARAADGTPVADRYCFDLNDSVFTPGDTICYVFRATNLNGDSRYFSRKFDGQGENFATSDIAEAMASPMEFTVLPAGGSNRGGDILYVDDADDRGGAVPIELFFDSVFERLGLRVLIDRYDVLAPSSIVSNSLASRVKNVTNQIIGPYRIIIWSSGSLARGLIGDGDYREKSDDFGLLYTFLDQHPDNPGLFITGDNNAEEWVTLSGSGAVNLRSTYMNFELLDGDHGNHDGQISPILTGGPAFTHLAVPDEFIAFGGCPVINDFDVLQPTGFARAELINAGASGDAYVISQATPNSAATTARVMLSGFSIHHAHDVRVRPSQFPWARFEMMDDVLRYFNSGYPWPTGIETTPQLVNYLDNNYPNPFNPTTTIRYGIKDKSHVSLQVYNAAGQLVRTLVHEVQTPTSEGFAVKWHGDSNAGSPVASGVYFYRLITGNFELTKKMVLLK
jgi:hypothetical protein